MQLIQKLWRGEVYLPRVYWLYGVVAGFVFNIVTIAIEKNFVAIYQYPIGRYLVLTLSFLPFIYIPFISVAIWKSANRYTGSKFWTVLAKVAVIFGGLILLVSANTLLSNKINEDELLAIANKLNKGLPVNVDESTRLDRVSVGNHELEYHYFITSHASNQIDAAEFRKLVNESVKPKVCASDELKILLKGGISLVYIYYGNNLREIARITISPSDCGYN